MIPNPWIIIAVLVALAALAGSWLTGWQMRGGHEDAARYDAALAYAAAYEREVDRVADVSAQAEKALAKIRTKARAREAQLRGELNNATYRTCMLPESGRMLYNAAVRDANRAAASEPVKPVHAAGTPADAGNDGRPAADGDK